MASSYALPTSALPHVHQGHMHAHAPSNSQPSLNALRTMSTSNIPLRSEFDTHDHDHGHDHSHEHEHNHDHDHGHSSSFPHFHPGRTRGHSRSHTSNAASMLPREKMPPPALNTLEGWTQERTPGGKSILSPGPATATTPYSPPDFHDHDHHHVHDHGHNHTHDHFHAHDHEKENNAQRSLFTRMLLPYTVQFPIINAIVIEKDSRRIFYFMM